MPLSQNAALLYDLSGVGIAEVNDEGASVALSGSPLAITQFVPVGFALDNTVALGVQRSTTGAASDKGRVVSWDVATGVQTMVGTAYTTTTAGTDATVVATNPVTGEFIVIPVNSSGALVGTTAMVYDPSTNVSMSIPLSQSGAKSAAFSNDGTKLAVAYGSFGFGTLPGKAVRVYDTSDWSEIIIPAPSTWHATLSAVTQCDTVSWSPGDLYLGFGFGAHLRVCITTYGDWTATLLAASRPFGAAYGFMWTPDGAHVAELNSSGTDGNGVAALNVRTFPALTSVRTFDVFGVTAKSLGILPDSDSVIIGRDFNSLYGGGDSFMSTILSGITIRTYTTSNALVFMAGESAIPPIVEAFWSNRLRTQEII